jgi:hypothetical protein
MRGVILLSALGLLACSGQRLFVGEDGLGGGHGGNGGAPIATASAGSGGGVAAGGAAGSIVTTGTGGALATGGMPGTGGTSGTSGTTTALLSLLAGDLNPAPAVSLSYPQGMTGDGTGFLYVTDTGGILKVDAATGETTLLAGRGSVGVADGTGAAAMFNNPWGEVTDGAGNLYVTDVWNHNVRKVVIATGEVTTLAGGANERGNVDGTGSMARFYGPGGIAIDGDGNLFVADQGNDSIRKIVIATGEVSTIATLDERGIIYSEYSTPLGLAADQAGNLYVADAPSFCIRKVVIATGAVTTLAGMPGQSGSVDGTGTAAQFDGPTGLVSDGAGNLYVTESYNTVRKIVIATGAVTTIAGTDNQTGNADGTGAAARFSRPQGLFFDGMGNVFVADSSNALIRRIVVATGNVTTLVWPGTGDAVGAAAVFKSPAGIASDGAGSVYVADSGNHTVRKVVIGTGAVTTVAGLLGASGVTDGTGSAARFNDPYGVAADGAGNLYVADTGSHTIRAIVLATGAVTTLAGTAGQLGSADGTGPAARFSSPAGVASDGAGNLYVADSSNHTVRKLAIATGTVTTVAGKAGQSGSADGSGAGARFNGPGALVADGTGNLYIADAGNSTLRRLTVATGAVTTLAGAAGQIGSTDGAGGNARFSYPYGIAADGAGNLYIADTGNGTVRKVAIGSGAVSTVIGSPGQLGVVLGALPASLNTPYGVVALPNGAIGLTDFSQNVVLVGHL